MAIMASRLAPRDPFPDKVPCPRCGFERVVRQWDRSKLCSDCVQVEDDLTRPPELGPQCGSWAGVEQHKARGERPCIDCAVFTREERVLRERRQAAAAIPPARRSLDDWRLLEQVPTAASVLAELGEDPDAEAHRQAVAL